jgi:acyl-CoA synthetase (AMP-forming)/AMP-acid ligase II
VTVTDAGEPSTFDVESLVGRRADERWNRTAVGDILERLSRSDPEKVAIIADEQAVADPRFARVTYRAGNETADRLANGLLALGLARGDRVAMLAENSGEAYLTKMGIAKAGLVVVPINPMMHDDVVEHMLRHVGARVAVVDADLWAARHHVLEAAGVEPVATIRGTVPGPEGVPEFGDFVDAAAPGEPDVRIHGDDIWEILLTSGTTSMPKAVMISHTYSYTAATSHAMSYARGVPLESDYRMLTFLPIIYHVGDHAYVLSTFLSGGSVVLGRRPLTAPTAAAVARERVTALWGGSPQFLEGLAAEAEAHPDDVDLSSLEVIVYGWGAMSPDLVARLTRLCGGRLNCVGIFGQTEAIVCHRFWPLRWPELHGRTAPEINYVGIPAPLLGAALMGPDGELVTEPGEPGEAVYRSPAVTAGYYRDAEATAAAFADGWFHSGDMVTYGEDGLRVMIDRFKDVVKSGGENVSSIRVESVLHQHPAVERAAVIGLPDPRWGEAVTAIIVPAGGAVVDEADIIAFCRLRLAGYETPKRVIVIDELPATVGGKVLKYRLRQQYGGAR